VALLLGEPRREGLPGSNERQQVEFRGPKQEMNVIGHQTCGEKFDPIF
jgi:hypothetical protein